MSTSLNASASGISFSGVGSGIDTASIVSALMKVERQPITKLKQQEQTVNQKNAVVSELDGNITAMRDAARKVSDPLSLQGNTVSVANTAVLGASVTDGAAKGTFNVTVNALAATHTMATAANPTLTAGGTLDVTVGGKTVSVSMNTGDTLQTFADRLNQTQDMGASASVVNNRLVLVSRTGGTAGTMTIGGTGAAALGLATTQPGADASATVNGVTVTGSSNAIEGSIMGVTLNLSSLGSTTFTVSADTAGVQKQAQAFVDSYNAMMSNIRSATAYDAASKTAGTLQGDAMFNTFMGNMRNIAGSTVTGGSAQYNSLAQIGITSDRTGTLTLDSTKFQAALAADPSALQRVFNANSGATTPGASDGIARRLAAFADDFSKNSIAPRQTGVSTTIAQMNKKIADLEDVMTVRENRLKAQFQAMDTAVANLRSQSSQLTSSLG
ncbi:MAG: flagellar filament capping protein FliD [Thermoleophilia bacterium]